MRTQYRILMFLLTVVLSFPSCRKDGRIPILNLKKSCLIISDTTHLNGKNGFSSYQFEPNGNRLTVAKKVTGNAVLLDYREVHYQPNHAMPDKMMTYLNANEFYETKFFYEKAATQPYKTELFFTQKLNNIDNKYLAGFHFYYDANERLTEVEYTTMVSGEQNYKLFIFYNDDDNVIRLEYEMMTVQHLPKSVITVTAFDDHPNPYSPIPYWKFLTLSRSFENYNPEPTITALSKNNPLDFTIGNFKREMTYIYNTQGFPVTRHNINKNATGENSYKESFNYRCP